MPPKKILIPIPTYGCDPSEVAIPWKLMKANGFDIIFITPDGKPGMADEVMLTGKGLGPFKRVLVARKDAIEAYREMEKDTAFQNPRAYSEVKVEEFDGLLLPGGHDKRVKEYLESKILQKLVVNFFSAKKPVAGICHGIVLAARSIDPKTGRSALHGYKTTALLETQELLGYNLTRMWVDDYYLTYPGLTVESEVKNALENKEDFETGPTPVLRDGPENMNRGFTVRDRNYISGRWPGDVYNLSLEFIQMVEST